MINKCIDTDLITTLRFPTAVAIVILHCSGMFNDIGFNDMPNSSPIGTYTRIRLLLSCITNLAVPLFFFFSGYLFFLNFKMNYLGFKRKLKKRVKTLLVPYLLWNIIALISTLFLISLGIVIGSKSFTDIGYFIEGLRGLHFFWDYKCSGGYNWMGMPDFLYTPINGPLWFVRELMVTVCVTPCIYYFLIYAKYYGLLIVVALYLTGININIPGLSISYVFAIGAFFGIHQISFVDTFRKLGIIACPSYFILSYFRILKYHTGTFPIERLFLLTGIITLVCFVSYINQKNSISKSEFLKSSCFFLYAVHTLILMFIGKPFEYMLSNHTDSFILILFYLFKILTVLFISLFLFWFCRNYMPRTSKLLTGSR